MPEPDIEDVIQKAIAGDTNSFRKIAEQLQAIGYSVAFRFTGNQFEAEDILQEAFIKLWKNLRNYRKEVKLTTWFYKIVANQSLDFLKSRQGKLRNKRDDLDRNMRTSFSADGDHERDELMLMIKAAAEKLTPKQQAVFILRDLEGLDVEEVVTILSMTAANVKSNLFHARRHIGEKLKMIYGEKPTL